MLSSVSLHPATCQCPVEYSGRTVQYLPSYLVISRLELRMRYENVQVAKVGGFTSDFEHRHSSKFSRVSLRSDMGNRSGPAFGIRMPYFDAASGLEHLLAYPLC